MAAAAIEASTDLDAQVARAKQKRPRTDPSALAAALKLAIQNGVFAPGQRLVEIDLMRRYVVSRACVRAALRAIEIERLVDIEKNRGAFVRRVTREEVIQTIDVLDELSVLTIRRVTTAIHDAAVRRTVEASRDAARRFQDTLDQAVPIARYVEETNKLWNSLTRCAGNVILEETHTRLQGLLHRIRLRGFVFRGREHRWVSYHVDMLTAMLNGDSREAVRLMRLAARDSKSAISGLPDEVFG
jgi:DNA-binding GntR family transcriptional regulator